MDLLIGFDCVEVDHGGGLSAMGGVGPLVVVESDPPPDAGSSLRAGLPSVQVDAFILQGSPEALDEDGVEAAPLAIQFHPDGAVLDYTSYANASAGTSSDLPRMLPAEIVAAWQTVLPGYDRTHHLMGTESVLIDGDRATTTSNIYATHILTNDGEVTWVFIGDYQHELERTDEGWKITFMRANLRAQLGNPDLPTLAAERVAAGQ